MKQQTVVCIGAGPAGLTAGYLLAKKDISVTVLEADPVYVGGISRTVEYNGCRLDIGGHRFFSKSWEVEQLWTELLGDDMLDRPRSSRIFYNGKLFDYPLRAFDALSKLGIIEAIRCVYSYMVAKSKPHPNPKNFEQWVVNAFGQRLFDIFFKTYTEKVWGMPCRQISSDWAAQRIKGLTLGSAVASALGIKKPGTKRKEVIKTLINKFRYPRRGPGMMWEKAAQRIQEMGHEVRMNHPVASITYRHGSEYPWLVETMSEQNSVQLFECKHVISSMPLRNLIHSLSPAVSEEAQKAASMLKYRDFLIVGLIIDGAPPFQDNWIYIHDPDVKVGRVQNFLSWSPEMVDNPSQSCLGMEYFCFEGDGLWTSSDEELIDLAKKEIDKLGLVSAKRIVDGVVVRQRKAYPVYDHEYEQHIEVIKAELKKFPNFTPIGRNGMHKYNNQDHAMMTAMLAVENIVQHEPLYDVWSVNQDAEYHEGDVSSSAQTGRLVPSKV